MKWYSTVTYFSLYDICIVLCYMYKVYAFSPFRGKIVVNKIVIKSQYNDISPLVITIATIM